VEVVESAACKSFIHKLTIEKYLYAISDVDSGYMRASGGAKPYKNLKEQGLKSAISPPIGRGEGELPWRSRTWCP